MTLREEWKLNIYGWFQKMHLDRMRFSVYAILRRILCHVELIKIVYYLDLQPSVLCRGTKLKV